MFRRKIFLYALSYSAGILIGFIVFEDGEFQKAAIFAGLCIFAVKVFLPYAERLDAEGDACCGDIDGEEERRRRKRGAISFMLFSMAAGFLIFNTYYFISQPLDDAAVSNVERIEGVVSHAEVKDGGLTVYLKAKAYPVYGEEKKLPGEVILKTRKGRGAKRCSEKEACELTGKRIRAYGKLYLPEPRRNPGAFDYRLYLKARKIYYCFSAYGLKVTDDGGRHPYRGYKRGLMRERYRFEEAFSDNGKAYGFVKGIVFGDKSSLNADVYEEFVGNSTAAVLAVSGLHVGFILALFRIPMKRRKTVGMSLAAIAATFLYGEMTLWSPATMRSVILIALQLAAFHLRRPYDLLSALSFAEIFVVTLSPYMLFDVGFRLSFLAMIGIAVFAPFLKFFLGRYLAFIAGIQAAIVPYIAFTFNRINFLSIFINVPVIFIASLIVPLSMVLMIIGMIFGFYPAALVKLIEALCLADMKVNSLLYFGGAFSNTAVSGGAWAIFAYYAFTFFVCSEYGRVLFIRRDKRNIVAACAMAAAFSLVIGCIFADPFRDDEIVFIDVGQ